MTESMEDAVKRIIVERCFLSIAPEEIGTEDDLLEAVGLDSVQILEVVVGLEEVFGVTFEDADFEIANFASVRAIVDYLRARGDR